MNFLLFCYEVCTLQHNLFSFTTSSTTIFFAINTNLFTTTCHWRLFSSRRARSKYYFYYDFYILRVLTKIFAAFTTMDLYILPAFFSLFTYDSGYTTNTYRHYHVYHIKMTWYFYAFKNLYRCIGLHDCHLLLVYRIFKRYWLLQFIIVLLVLYLLVPRYYLYSFFWAIA